MGNDVAIRFPWEPTVQTTEDTVAALQRDFAYAVRYTAILVHSDRAELGIVVNTLRGQTVPKGRCTFTDGSYIEFQDIGMPQVGAPELSVTDLLARVYEIARELGLELAQ